ncbi:MAG: hypothetical protein H6811_09435 [Phycisphaeraceae bacterium]|nr:hypothetical protein [Phycisphaeraceae bacterium]
MGRIASVIAASFALTAYAIATVAGFAAGNPTPTILLRGLLVLIVCHAAGQAIGAVAGVVIRDHNASYEAANPIPSVGEIEDAISRQRALEATGA